jgi:hypothetical protein
MASASWLVFGESASRYRLIEIIGSSGKSSFGRTHATPPIWFIGGNDQLMRGASESIGLLESSKTGRKFPIPSPGIGESLELDSQVR